MRHRLPSIHITVANSRQFLEKMADIAGKSGSFTIHHYPNEPASEDHTVSLLFTEPSPHSDLGAHLVCNANAKSNVAVEIRAGEWVPENFPSYETYCAAAKTMINPLLKVYNREEDTRYRMTIMSKEKLEPKLPPRSAQLFKYFTATANTSILHSSDWRRFYEFVRVCRANVSAYDLEYLLIKEGFSEQYAQHIVEIYEHLCDFKRPRNSAETLEYYSVVKGYDLSHIK